MAEMIRHSGTCTIRTALKGKTSEAVVTAFEEKKLLNVIVNKSVKISLKWNGTCYEGQAAGIDFESDGPEISRTRTGRY